MNDSLRKLSNEDLVRKLDQDVARERAMTIAVLHDLNEMDRRRLYLDRGCSSLFDYCVRKLKYSSSAATRRIQAARCIRRFPVVLGMLERNEITLSTVATVASILKPDNCTVVLNRVRGASCRQVERIACDYRSPVTLRDQVRPVRLVTPGAGSECRQFAQFLADDEFVQLLEEVRVLLSRDGHRPSIAEVLKVTLKEYRDRHSPVARQERRAVRTTTVEVAAAKVGEAAGEAPGPDSRRRAEGATKSRHIADDVRDAVFVRDEGMCTFVAKDGTRCDSRHGLQIDHIKPFAAGGTHEASNLRLLCAAHNRRAAELTLGKRIMQPFWRPV